MKTLTYNLKVMKPLCADPILYIAALGSVQKSPMTCISSHNNDLPINSLQDKWHIMSKHCDSKNQTFLSNVRIFASLNTGTFSSKCATKLSLKIPPHLNASLNYLAKHNEDKRVEKTPLLSQSYFTRYLEMFPLD